MTNRNRDKKCVYEEYYFGKGKHNRYLQDIIMRQNGWLLHLKVGKEKQPKS